MTNKTAMFIVSLQRDSKMHVDNRLIISSDAIMLEKGNQQVGENALFLVCHSVYI